MSVRARISLQCETTLISTVFLEQILLDESGNVRPQFDDQSDKQAAGNAIDNVSGASGEVPAGPSNIEVETTAPRLQEHLHTSAPTNELLTATNPLKRKHVDSEPEPWMFATEELDFARHLPSQAVLLKVVDFFTTSFHHWIPYLHKQRLHNKVNEGVCSNGLLLVLHALVAVALRHMDPNVLFMDNDQIQRQSNVSRTIVETHAIRSVSVESLQALIFIVFDYVSTSNYHRTPAHLCSSMMVRIIAPGL